MARLHLSTRVLLSLSLVSVALNPIVARAAGAQADAAAGPLYYGADGSTVYGNWHADLTLTDTNWQPGGSARVYANLQLPVAVLTGLAGAGVVADQLCLLVTAERTFDQNGWMRLASEDAVSTLLTPTGLAIEGGVQGAVTNRYGYPFRSPVDVFVSMPLAEAPDTNGTRRAAFNVGLTFPADLPPGLYRVRVDFGVMVGKRLYNLNGATFTSRPFDPTRSYGYSPIVEASGPDAAGRFIDATQLQPRCPWLLLATYNSNGYRGVVSDEDAPRFAISARSLIADEVILPMYSDGGSRLSYSLEPSFPVDTIDSQQNLAWNWSSGEWSVRITNPDGTITDLGTSSFQGKAKYGIGPTTNWTSLTAWKPPAYGRYTVLATGWIADGAGRRFVGGGTYRFWIAKRMTLATATFQGMPYPVGSSYGRDIQFNPAMPADVSVTATLYVDSDPARARELTYCGKASPAGIFGVAQGMKPFPLDAPGEYHAKVLATYTDPGGHLWVSTMRHAGVVYPTGTQVIARGKKLLIGGKYFDRGSTAREGYVEANGTAHLEHLAFPYQSGDVMLVASENQGANKIEPVLTYQMQGDASAWDTKLNGVGTTNLRIKTSNGYSPHLYPEYITDIEYYYGAAPRPGFMGRFIVGESTSRAPYWPTSPNSFGGQIGATANGDAPGDIYRLIGGVVIRRVGQAPMYAGYIASAFLLPKGSNDNGVIAPGTAELHGPMGDTARFFLVGLRPGTSYEVGSSFRAGGQIDPILPVNVHFVLTYPDGRQRVADVVGDSYGAFAGPTAWTLDVPGVYRYQLSATWNGFRGGMPGLPDTGGEFYVYSKTRPMSAAGLTIDGSPHRTFAATGTTTIVGSSSAASVHYTMVTPGAVIGQGELPVIAGKFTLVFDPAAVHAKVPLYDVVNNTTGAAQIGRVVHITFFSEENSAGQTFHDVTRVLLRGTTVLSARAPLPDTLKPVLTISRSGQGSITVPMGNTGAVDCDSCSLPLPAGTTVTLMATAAPGSIFVGWTGACSGMGPCTVTVDAATSVGATFQSVTIRRQYFAEGAATTFFDCEFALANPGDATAHVTMRFLKDGGATVVHTLDVPPGSRRTVDAKLVPGLAPAPGFSTIVESDAPVIADRTMSWDRTHYGSHAEVAIEAPAQTWYLAEGSTAGGFQLYYLLENPNERATDVQVTYLRPSPLAPIVRTHSLPALSRRTVLVNGEAPELAAVDVSGIVSSLDPTAPIIVERAMYLDAPGQFYAAGTDSAGVTAPATDWFLAEGATIAPFDTYVLLANPGDSAATAEVSYFTGSGRTVRQVHQLAPKSRFTIWVNGVTDEAHPGETLANETVSTAVHADVPIIVERAMWWPSNGTGWREAHVSSGARGSGTAWALAGGEQGGAYNTQTYVLLTNTSSFDGRVRMTLLQERGNPVVREVDVPASSRTTVWMGGASATALTPFGGLTNGTRFGVLVESQAANAGTAQIVVERAMYSDAPGEAWAAGTGVVATRLR